jgi:hypothetical protein
MLSNKELQGKLRACKLSTDGKRQVGPCTWWFLLVICSLHDCLKKAGTRECTLPFKLFQAVRNDAKPKLSSIFLQDWEQRYNKFRVEVQCAQDAGEHVALDEIARRVNRKEKQTAAAVAAFAAPRSKPTVTGMKGGHPSESVQCTLCPATASSSLSNGDMSV